MSLSLPIWGLCYLNHAQHLKSKRIIFLNTLKFNMCAMHALEGILQNFSALSTRSIISFLSQLILNIYLRELGDRERRAAGS
jgi:hypothetical protein